MHNVQAHQGQRLTAKQLEAFEAAKAFVHYTELHLAGAIAGQFDANAKCIRALDDSLRLMRLQGGVAASGALPSATPTAISKALHPFGVEGMDDMLRSTEPRAFDHVAEASAIAGIAIDLSTGEVAA